jgi:hypothetical protein
MPKAIGVFAGKACFSLSNFVMSAPEASPTRKATFEEHYTVPLDPNYPNLPYGTHAPRSMVAKAVFKKGGVKQVSFLPTLIDTKLRPEILLNGDTRFDDALQYMEWASDGSHRFTAGMRLIGRRKRSATQFLKVGSARPRSSEKLTSVEYQGVLGACIFPATLWYSKG